MSCPHGEWHDTDCEICQQLAAKDEEIARLREDAERYRWLRSYRGSSIDIVYNYGGNEELDGVIDAARKETK